MKSIEIEIWSRLVSLKSLVVLNNKLTDQQFDFLHFIV